MIGGVTDVPAIGPSSQLAHLQQIRGEQQQLAEIDRRFREMILKDASQWNLEAIEREYRELQQVASHKPISGQIDMRYPAIERYRRRLSKMLELKQLTSQTEMRDAELVARVQGLSAIQSHTIASAGPESISIPGQTPLLSEAFEAFLHRDTSNIASGDDPEIVATDGASGSVATTESPSVLTPGSPQNQYIGAGIVQKVASGDEGSGYVLVTPSGRILADLKPTGNIRLDEFVGQQVGVQGSRWSEKEKRDIIEVSAMEPVRLRQ